MKKSERLLLIAVIGIGVIGVGQLGFSRMKTVFGDMYNQKNVLNKQIGKLKVEQVLSLRAVADLNKYREMSLSSNSAEAKAQYEHWLAGLIEDDAGFDSVTITAGNPKKIKEAFDMITFDVNAVGDLQKLTKFLHDFYSQDYLHKIRRLDIRPRANRENGLTLDMSIDVVSMHLADPKPKMEPLPADRLEFGDLATYQERILNRNLYGKPNEPPTMFVSTQTLTVGRDEEVNLRLNAGERSQEIKVEIVEHDFPEGEAPTVDGKTLKVKRTAEGTHKVKLKATDNGLPPKSIEKEIQLSFKNPEPEKKEDNSFDVATVAFFTAFVEADGVPEAWISVRTTGKTLRVHIDDEVEVGSVKGVVKSITSRRLEIKTEDGDVVVDIATPLIDKDF